MTFTVSFPTTTMATLSSTARVPFRTILWADSAQHPARAARIMVIALRIMLSDVEGYAEGYGKKVYFEVGMLGCAVGHIDLVGYHQTGSQADVEVETPFVSARKVASAACAQLALAAAEFELHLVEHSEAGAASQTEIGAEKSGTVVVVGYAVKIVDVVARL